jgi:hypothetical protein
MYCKDCEKSIDYFEVFESISVGNQNNAPVLIHTIKAYTWNDVIKFVKNKYLKDQNDLVIDCEKDFAYLERQNRSNELLSNPVEQSTSYQIYLRKDNYINFNKNANITNKIIDLTMYNNY